MPYTFFVDRLAFEHYLTNKAREGLFAADTAVGSAGNAVCGDVVKIGLRLDRSRIASARYEAEGCGATRAAASACAELTEGRDLIQAALISTQVVAEELGGLSKMKIHAAELAADALHRAMSKIWAGQQAVRLPQAERRVLVAMSGGVDSAVAALISKQRGDEVIGVTLKLWSDPATDGTKACCSPQAVTAARSLAHEMGMPHFTLDLQQAFRSAVVENYLSEHRFGRTPNPCVRCNGMIRFSAMLELAELLGAERLLTGHYARIARDCEGRLLEAAVDRSKDQAYMLAALDPSLLDRVEFPLGAMTKAQVRAVAEEAGLPVAGKAESQDLCFLAGSDRNNFLERHGGIGERSGEIVDIDGNLLGVHGGHHNYTVGQRKGLGVAAPQPVYVLSTDAKRNRVVVGPRQALATDLVDVASVTLYRAAGRVNRVKLRYRQNPVACVLDRAVCAGRHERVAVKLLEPVDGVSPGQTACFMEDERVLGLGVIGGSMVSSVRLQSQAQQANGLKAQASLA